MPSRLHPLVSRSMWVTGATLISQVTQLAYSIVTARLLTPEAFGTYATALAAMGLIALIAPYGLDLAVARAQTSVPQMRALVTTSTLMGVGAACLTLGLASPWAHLWGDPSAAILLQILALAVLVTPFNAVVAGIARRRGRFRQLSLVQAASTFLGVAAGVLLVYETRAAWALPVSLVIVAVGTAILGPRAAGNEGISLGRPRRDTLDFLSVGRRALTTNLIEYTGWALLQWSTSRAVGTASLGQLNRSLAFASMPIMAVNTGLSHVLTPVYGAGSDGGRRREQLGRATVLSTWIGLVSAGAVAALTYPLIPVVIGSEWALAAQLSVLMAIGSGGSVAGAPMSVYLQSQDRFREYRRIQYITLGLYLVACASLLMTHQVVWAAAGYAAVTWARYALLLAHLRRGGDLSAPLPAEFGLAVLASTSMSVLLGALLTAVVGGAVSTPLLMGAVGGLASAAFVTRARSMMPELARDALRVR